MIAMWVLGSWYMVDMDIWSSPQGMTELACNSKGCELWVNVLVLRRTSGAVSGSVELVG